MMIIPTVHLSLPEAVYRELRREAEELGIQITDLIKILIKEGLERRRNNSAQNNGGSAGVNVDKNVLEEILGRLYYLEGMLVTLSETVKFLSFKIEELETSSSEELNLEPIVIPPKRE